MHYKKLKKSVNFRLIRVQFSQFSQYVPPIPNSCGFLKLLQIMQIFPPQLFSITHYFGSLQCIFSLDFGKNLDSSPKFVVNCMQGRLACAPRGLLPAADLSDRPGANAPENTRSEGAPATQPGSSGRQGKPQFRPTRPCPRCGGASARVVWTARQKNVTHHTKRCQEPPRGKKAASPGK